MPACSRREFLGTLAGAPLVMSRALAASPAKPPNIVFFYTDDQSMWSVRAYGNPHSHTPNMDRLAREGAIFDNMFVTTPVCSPARGSMFTSRYSCELGIRDWLNEKVEPDAGLPTQFPTWAQQLQRAGYKTGLFGKWHLGVRPEFHPTRRGYDRFYGFLGGGNSPQDPTLEVEGVTKQVPGFLVDLVTDQALTFLRENKSKPFLVSLHYREPHMPYLPVPEQDAAHFQNVLLDLPNYEGVDPDWLQKTRRDYYKSIAAVDRNIGRVLGELASLSLDRNTLVIFSSDNGYMIGQHGLWHKGNATWVKAGRKGRRPNMYDFSLRVPLVMRWPGVISPGRHVAEMATNLDFFPTILEACRVPAPAGYEPRGLSVLPLLDGRKPKWRSEVYGDYHMIHGYDETMRMVRTRNWKLIVHKDPQYLDELYNLEKDPDEDHNLIADPSAQERKEQLLQMLDAWQSRMKDPERGRPREPKHAPYLND